MKVDQLKAGVILSYVGEAIAIITGLLYTPFMLRTMGQSEHGLYSLASTTISYLGLLSLGIGSSYIRYYAKCKVKNDDDGIAKLNGMFVIVFSVIACIVALGTVLLTANADLLYKEKLTADELSKVKIIMALLGFNMAISFPMGILPAYISANERFLFRRIVALAESVLNPLLSVVVLLSGFRSIGLVVLHICVNFAITAVNYWYCKKRLGIRFIFGRIDLSMFREMFMFSFWIFLNQIVDQINWSVDTVVLGAVSGTIAVSVYGIASTLNGLYKSFSTAIVGVFSPRVNKLVAANGDDNREINALFVKVGRIQFIVLALVISGLIFFGKFFILWWAGENYADSYATTLLLTIPVTIPLIQNLGIEIQRAKNRHQLRSIVYTIIAVLNIAATIPLAKKYGSIGAAMGTAFSLLIGNGLIMNIIYQKKIGLDVIAFWKQILRFAPALVLPVAFGIVIHKYIHYSTFIEFALLVAAYTAVYCISMWFLGMNDFEKNMIRQPISRIWGRIKK